MSQGTRTELKLNIEVPTTFHTTLILLPKRPLKNMFSQLIGEKWSFHQPFWEKRFMQLGDNDIFGHMKCIVTFGLRHLSLSISLLVAENVVCNLACNMLRNAVVFVTRWGCHNIYWGKHSHFITCSVNDYFVPVFFFVSLKNRNLPREYDFFSSVINCENQRSDQLFAMCCLIILKCMITLMKY